MSEHLHRPLISRIKNKLRAHKYSELEIGWFGGEPLLGISVIDKLSPELSRIARDNNCNYRARIVTNGLKLTDQIASRLILQHHVRSIEVTLDGTAPFHDLRRCTKNKRLPTFQAILNNVIRIAHTPEFNSCTLKIRW